MKKTAYIRVSTKAQSYDRQHYDLTKYFESHGVDPTAITFVEEKITSHTSFKERAIFPLLNDAQTGDIIYVCQLDRLGRTVEDIISLVKFADSKGVEIYAIKEGQRITYTTQTGKMMLTLLAMVAEMERELRAERCQSGREAAMEEIRKNGFRIARCSGRIQTHMGNKPGEDVSAAAAAASIARHENAVKWKSQSMAYRRAMRKKAEGWSLQRTADDLKELYHDNPEVYCTPKGCCPSKGTISRWWNEKTPFTLGALDAPIQAEA